MLDLVLRSEKILQSLRRTFPLALFGKYGDSIGRQFTVAFSDGHFVKEAEKVQCPPLIKQQPRGGMSSLFHYDCFTSFD